MNFWVKAFLYIYLFTVSLGIGFSQTDFKQFTVEDELPSDHISCITQSRRGFIWIRSTEGTAYFNGYEWTTLRPEEAIGDPPTFNCSSDLSKLETSIKEQLISYNINSYFKDDQGSTWVGTEKNGLLYFPSETIDSKVGVVFEFIGFNNKIVREFETEIQVDHRYQTLSIAYTALDFRSKKRAQYRYKIEGIHTDWVLTKEPKVQFTSLPDRGSYIFAIQVLQPDGEWSSSRELRLHFLTPFYKTYAFIGIVILLIIVLVVSAIRWYVRRKLRLKQLESKLKDLEGKALQSQMNPHFVFNALNSIQSFIAVGETMRSEVYLAKFSNLLRRTLQNSRQKAIPLAQEIENVEIYLALEKMRFEDKLSYTLEVDKALEPEMIRVPPMLLQPFIENAIVHGLAPKPTGGRITIKIEAISDEVIRYIVQDDGVGRKKNSPSEHVSLGTDIVRQRLSLYKETEKSALLYEDLKDEKGNAIGTKVELMVPII